MKAVSVNVAEDGIRVTWTDGSTSFVRAPDADASAKTNAIAYDAGEDEIVETEPVDSANENASAGEEDYDSAPSDDDTLSTPAGDAVNWFAYRSGGADRRDALATGDPAAKAGALVRLVGGTIPRTKEQATAWFNRALSWKVWKSKPNKARELAVKAAGAMADAVEKATEEEELVSVVKKLLADGDPSAAKAVARYMNAMAEANGEHAAAREAAIELGLWNDDPTYSSPVMDAISTSTAFTVARELSE